MYTAPLLRWYITNLLHRMWEVSSLLWLPWVPAGSLTAYQFSRGYALSGISVASTNPVLYCLFTTMCASLIPQLSPHTKVPLSKYITFTRPMKYAIDRSNCDWCSIANGFIHWAREVVDEHPDVQLHTRSIWFTCFYLTLVHNGSIRQATRHLRGAPGDVSGALSAIASILDEIELVWCPFKAMDSYWRNMDPRFVSQLPYWHNVARTLAEAGEVCCIECAKVCNTTHTTTAPPSLERGTLTRMMDLQTRYQFTS